MAGACLPHAHTGAGWRPRTPPLSDMFHAAVTGDQEWLKLNLKRKLTPTQTNKKGLTVLHVATQHGQLECMKLLVESRLVDVNASCPRGRRPLHMALCPQSRTNSYACLAYLLEQGAEPNIGQMFLTLVLGTQCPLLSYIILCPSTTGPTGQLIITLVRSTDDGLTPLHMAAAAGNQVCVEMLVGVGADTHAQDSRGHTPFDLACASGDRVIARFLKNAMWQNKKKKDMETHKTLQNLRQNLILMHSSAEDQAKAIRKSVNDHKVCEWAKMKGLPLLWSSTRDSHPLSPSFHKSTAPPQTKAVRTRHPGASPKPWSISPNPSRPPQARISRPQGVRMGIHLEEEPPEPDLRQSVKLGHSGNGLLHYTTSWESVPHPLPALPLDVIQKCFFPSAFPSRIASPSCFWGSSVLDLPHRGCNPEPGALPWSEVAMHLAETLEPGHY